MVETCVQIKPGSLSQILTLKLIKIPNKREVFSNLSILQKNKEAGSTVAHLIALHRTELCSGLIRRVQTAPNFVRDLRQNMHSSVAFFLWMTYVASFPSPQNLIWKYGLEALSHVADR